MTFDLISPNTFIYLAAASFTISPVQIIAENNSVLEICATMMTIPSGGTLATDVDLTLTPISGTGEKTIIALKFSNQTLFIEHFSHVW